MTDRRLKAVWDVQVPVIRELAGVHEYDGVVMDLSPGGRKAALGRLGCASPGERLADRHDESHLTAAEQAAHAEAEAGLLRWNPLPHIQNLDVSCYDREYARSSAARTAVRPTQTCRQIGGSGAARSGEPLQRIVALRTLQSSIRGSG